MSIRYLKNSSQEQIKDIFQRINSTEYSLNKTERLNAQWGESEFVCFAKQIIEDELDIDTSLLNYQISNSNRQFFLHFFHRTNKVFTENDVSRMLALQYILTLLATLIEGSYFRRNDKVQSYIEEYNEEFIGASDVEYTLKKTLQFIDGLQLGEKSYWFNKANIFTLIVELYKIDIDFVDSAALRAKLLNLENNSKIYNQIKTNDSDTSVISDPEKLYFEYAKEGVNEQTVREYRGEFLSALINSSIIQKK